MNKFFKLIPYITLMVNLASRLNSQNCSHQYVVVSGNNCDKIGAEFGVAGSAIISANPSISSGCTNLQVGQILCIPDRSCMHKYTVVNGDICDGIGAEFSVTASAIISANPSINIGCTNLQVGQILCIPDRSCMQKYTVVSGETCDRIGAEFGVSGSGIISANPIINSWCTNLEGGQIICIPDRSCVMKYDVVSEDTCKKIGTEFGVRGTAIISANPTINSGCTNMQVGMSLCIPDRSCTQEYPVVSGDTCNRIGALFAMTGSAIIFANPTINSGCTNLQVGQILCIPDRSCMQKYTVVNGDRCDRIAAAFGINGSAIISANPIINSECTNIKVGQLLCIPDTSCTKEYVVLIGDTCDNIGAEFNVTGSEIIAANPNINSGCTNLQDGQILCIPEISCAQQYTVSNGDNCNIIAAKFSITVSDIISANPTVRPRCHNLQDGEILCIPDGSCQQKYTVVSGDVCYRIGDMFSVSSSAIMSANPAVNSGCTNLEIGQVLCIPDRSCMQKYAVVSGDTCDGIGAAFNMTGSAINSANPTISGCTNVEVGQILCIPDRSCIFKYTVVSGDSCSGIGAEFNITGSDIVSANPKVNSGCTNLQTGQVLCIPDGSCTQEYTVVSGDNCNLVGAMFGVTGSAIMSANPIINSGCTNLQVGQTLCVPSSGRGMIGNWLGCTTNSTCADNWLCCVAPADCSTQKTTCRPGGDECSSCDRGSSKPTISLVTTIPTISPAILNVSTSVGNQPGSKIPYPTFHPTKSSRIPEAPHLKQLFIAIFTLLSVVIIALCFLWFFLVWKRGQDTSLKHHAADIPSIVQIQNSDDISSIGHLTGRVGIPNNC
jgi:LysM repeat protein